MRVLFKAPGRKEFQTLLVANELRILQLLVGDGPIETVTIAEDACIICNEEGRLQGMPHNCTYLVMGEKMEFVGPIMIVGVDGDEFTDCPMSVTMANGGIWA